MRLAAIGLCKPFGADRLRLCGILALASAVVLLVPAGPPEANASALTVPSPSREHFFRAECDALPSGVLLLAKMVEKEDQIIYRTDFGELRHPDQAQRDEKEKEDRAWQMLDRMEIYQYRGRPPRPPREDRRQ
ncbi:MAG: hypothetical protein WAW37_17400 [Syntrophobacteraceae bacterium]